jgi:hypothetical protein
VETKPIFHLDAANAVKFFARSIELLRAMNANAHLKKEYPFPRLDMVNQHLSHWEDAQIVTHMRLMNYTLTRTL